LDDQQLYGGTQSALSTTLLLWITRSETQSRIRRLAALPSSCAAARPRQEPARKPVGRSLAWKGDVRCVGETALRCSTRSAMNVSREPATYRS
jgi:hypothetical protein